MMILDHFLCLFRTMYKAQMHTCFAFIFCLQTLNAHSTYNYYIHCPEQVYAERDDSQTLLSDCGADPCLLHAPLHKPHCRGRACHLADPVAGDVAARQHDNLIS